MTKKPARARKPKERTKEPAAASPGDPPSARSRSKEGRRPPSWGKWVFIGVGALIFGVTLWLFVLYPGSSGPNQGHDVEVVITATRAPRSEAYPVHWVSRSWPKGRASANAPAAMRPRRQPRAASSGRERRSAKQSRVRARLKAR